MRVLEIHPKLLLVTLFLFFTCYLCAEDKMHWSDLPPDHLYSILYEYDDRIDELDNHIQYYHTLVKNDWDFVPKRIALLKKISSLAKSTSCLFSTACSIEEKYLYKALYKFSIIASRKQKYLEELFRLKIYKLEALKQDIYMTEHVPKKYIPFTINDGRKIKYQTQEIWGQYFIEAVDPCHRRFLNPHHDIWVRLFPGRDLSDFFLWLEDKNVSLFFPAIAVPTGDALAQHRVEIQQGRFYSYNGELITTDPIEKEEINPEVPNFIKEPIFIIDSNEDLYLGYSGRQFAHTSLSHYRPIIGSGTIWSKDGLMTKLSLNSGHYLTNMEQNIQTFKILEEKGAIFDHCTEVLYFDGYHEKSLSVDEFKKKYL